MSAQQGPAADLIIRNALVWGTDAPQDLAIFGGRYIAASESGIAGAQEIDAAGRLCIPGFVEPHIHLDKVLLAESVPVNRSGSLNEAIVILGERKATYTVGEIAERAGRIVTSAIANGVTHMRTHIDVDSGCGLVPIDALLEVRRRFAEVIDLQIVAFPQLGIVKDPGTAALLEQAMERGADVVGGMPFNEAGTADSAEHIRIAFEIAQAHDADVDMHIDETDDPNARTLEMLCEATVEAGWQGRVTAGHTCALAAYAQDYADHVIGLVAQAGIHMITNPATNLMLQGRDDDHPKRRGITRVKELLARGVNVSFGQDNLRDMFYPFGRDDPLELAWLTAHAAHMSQPDEIEAVFAMPTVNGARVLGLSDYGTEPGCAGDLVILDAYSAAAAITAKADRSYVIKRGRVVAQTETRTTHDLPVLAV
ncbi:MAG: amidohydrolase family protein [Alphaproteobacteria bacterium]|nr:amidohydrolase family protein [Alphaproteobacteria bacterium]